MFTKKTFSRVLSIVMIGMMMPVPTTPAYAAPNGLGVSWYVATTGNDSNSCTTVGSPCLTINGAIGKATNGDTIYVATGTYTGSGTEVVLVNKSVTLSGGWDVTFTTKSGVSTIDGQNARRGVNISVSITTYLENFVVQNGDLADGKNGINNDGNLTLEKVTIQHNGTNAGSGIISGINNSATGILNLINSAVINNGTADNCFGGIFNQGNFTAINSTISGNISNEIYCYGAALMGFGTVSLKNTTIVENIGTTDIMGGYGGTFTLENSLIGSCGNTTSMTSQGYNIISINDCPVTPIAGDQFGSTISPIDLMIWPLQNNGGTTFTHSLISGSPAINAGNPAIPGSGGSACLATDQRGISRPVSIACDIGAFEGEVPAVQISGNAGVAGAILSYTNIIPQTVIANGSGLYSILVPVGWSGTVTPSKSGYSFMPVNRIYTNVVANQTAQNYYIGIQDPSFELYINNPYWDEYSINFGTPLCIIVVCGNGAGSAGPRTGSAWVWFGGTSAPLEQATVLQSITFPSSGSAILQFYLWIGLAQPGSDSSDVLRVDVGSIPVFSTNATQQSLYPAYTLVTVDVSSFADGNVHVIAFNSITTNQVVNFNVDDVTLTDDTSLVNSVLPTSRTPVVGNPVTVFNTVINAGFLTANDVTLSMNPAPAGTFSYFQTSCATNAVIGGANPALDIPVGGVVCYVLVFTPSAAFSATFVHIQAQASNAPSTNLLSGINTWLLRSTVSAGPDIIALTTTTDFHQVACFGTNFFAVAMSNVGTNATGDITVSANTGSVSLPVTILIEETNPGTGNIIGDNILQNVQAGQNRTTLVTVNFNGCVPFDPALNRIFIEFRDASNNILGSTSTAISTNR